MTVYGLVGGIGATLVNGVGFGSTNGGYFIFDGSDDYITSSINSGITSTQSRTLCAWAKFNNIASSVVCGIGDANSIYNLFEIQAYQNRLIGHRFGDYINGSTVLSTGVWYFTSFTYDGTTSKLYLNANLEVSAVQTLSTTDTPLTIGKKGYNLNSNMSGLVSGVQLYNRALSQQEILQNYNATKKRYGL